MRKSMLVLGLVMLGACSNPGPTAINIKQEAAKELTVGPCPQKHIPELICIPVEKNR